MGQVREIEFQIYNSMTKQKEKFTPLVPGKVSLYVCGVTSYDFSHIGHARAYVAFDVLFRYLKYLGYEVKYVRNFTDVDDKDKTSSMTVKREKQGIGLLKRKKPSPVEQAVKVARMKASRPQLDSTVVDLGPPADWVKINVQRTKDCFEVYALVPGLLREEHNLIPPSAVISAGSVTSACTAGAGKMYMLGKIKNTGDCSMYPKPLMDLREVQMRTRKGRVSQDYVLIHM